MKGKIRNLLLGCVMWLAAVNPAIALEPEEGDVFIRVIDVGPGLSCVVKMPDGHFMIYDAGDKNRATNQISQVIPKNSKVDLLVLSHSDADHLGATPFICKQYQVVTAIHSGLLKPSSTIPSRPTEAWANAMSSIRSEVRSDRCKQVSLKSKPLVPGQVYQLGDVKITMIYGLHKPPPEWGFSTTKNTSEYYNSGSIVVRLEYKGKSVLFCGDTVGRHIDDPVNTCIAAELAMVDNANTVNIDSDVIIAPHHGADNGSSTPFIQAVSPKYVIFSAGHKFSHPRSSAAQRYLNNGVSLENIYRTDWRDDEGGKEWPHGRQSRHSDKPGDDDVDILIRKSGQIVVAYREASNN